MTPSDPRLLPLSTTPYALHEALAFYRRHATEAPRPESLRHMSVLIEEYQRLSDVALRHIRQSVLEREGFRQMPP